MNMKDEFDLEREWLVKEIRSLYYTEHISKIKKEITDNYN